MKNRIAALLFLVLITLGALLLFARAASAQEPFTRQQLRKPVIIKVCAIPQMYPCSVIMPVRGFPPLEEVRHDH